MASDPMDPINILAWNPNSSQEVTDGLVDSLTKRALPPKRIFFGTGPPSAPPSINDPPTSVQSAAACFELWSADAFRKTWPIKDIHAILVCCFSDHPLVGMLRHHSPAVPVMHILEAGVLAALQTSRGRGFGIVTTGADMVRDIDAGVAALLGSSARGNDRYLGCVATGLAVLQLGDEAQQDHVHNVLRTHVVQLAQRGSLGAVILGCAGMTGMEDVVRKGLAEALGEQAAKQIAIIDGAVAGVHLLEAQVRSQFYSD